MPLSKIALQMLATMSGGLYISLPQVLMPPKNLRMLNPLDFKLGRFTLIYINV